ncbi:CCAAT/enhancer-binding protein zeta-like [Rhagoletis pomonella]|uniref:CCAAT/enhancer-binding protein zeta-like n=1 Tax=Rhagoletis pomonella TaxID=28610 RepID=UPI00177CC831|nr:CCAAT/enhancer-binding protein zeta-like [Rhagoletis pomonella]
MAPPAASGISISTQAQNKKIVFDDDGQILEEGARGKDLKGAKKEGKKKKLKGDKRKGSHGLQEEHNKQEDTENDENDYFAKREKKRQQQKDEKDDADTNKKWFNVYPEYPSSEEVLDMKESEQMELYNLCKNAFEAELTAFSKRDASDARWLQTALRKGTAKDRANAGALLVTSNPLGNLEALSTLIGFTKQSNKASNEVMTILVDLWKKVLLPPHRKLLSLQMRGADWKLVRKNTTLSKDKQRRIYAYWYFENELKDQYFEFLRNLQQAIQTGQEHNKNVAIVAASQLLSFAPEKEQMILTLLINKLGDPTAKVASKALHHLSEVAHRHPNMCGVIVAESEKLLFRNNISERAQHFALCFLASIATSGRPEVCTKLVNICFALFKVLVEKGAVNNRTMQAILRCLQKAILEAKPTEGSSEILSKDMQDTIYRMVHLADIRVSVQTLGLLLQLMTVKTEKSDRFYNALYKKMHDLEVINVGVKTAAQLLHIIHRAIHIDGNVQRAQAFIKRLLQCALYMPPNMAAGCLIVINKLLRSRKELAGGVSPYETKDNSTNVAPTAPKVKSDDAELSKFDSDGEEKYEDIRDEEETANEENLEERNDLEESKVNPSTISSWHHAKLESSVADAKVRDIAPNKYDPYHRVPSFAGAEFALRHELLLLREHFHPTVQVFANNILQQKRIDYYGDPLRDFGLPHFLERFAFKNPKKLDQKDEAPIITHKRYVSFGTRGKPVKSLTKANCTEDEMYIFNFLEQKRQQTVVNKIKKKEVAENEEDEQLKEGEVGDDEFEEYLGSYFGKKAKAAADAEDGEEELDFLKELGGELKSDSKKKNKKSSRDDDEDDLEDIDADWGDDNIEEGDLAGDNDVSDDDDRSIDGEEDDDAGSISFDEEDGPDDLSDDGEESMSEDMSDDEGDDDDDDDDEDGLSTTRKKKSRKRPVALNEKSFAKKLKHSDDMSSLFAAADDFAELLEETGKTKGHGTSNALFNKDKSSAKQMKWEEKRHSNSKSYTKRSKKVFAGQRNTNKKRK